MKDSGLARRGSPLALVALLGVLAGCGSESTTPSVTLLSPPQANDKSPSFSPDGSHVAYWTLGASGYVLMLARGDRSAPVALDTVGVASTSRPVWSPDGATLAYGRGYPPRIWVASLRGGPPHRLTKGQGLEIPAIWDPRGDGIMFVATTSTGFAVGEVSVASGDTTSIPMPEIPAGARAFPVWSPDRSHIAYDVNDGDKHTIWVADSLGQHGRQLTNEGFESFGGFPWSPGGSRIAYVSRRTGRGDVWVADVEDDSLRQLTRDVREDYAPAWSPDGRWIAFLSDRGLQTDVWVVPASGGRPRRVTNDGAVENDLQWVGKSTRLAFTTPTTHNGLWTRSLTDTLERRITPDSMGLTPDAWDLSPDGRSLVFQVVHSRGFSDLDVIPVAGGPPRVLVTNGAYNSQALWSPDGSQVVYVSDKSGSDDVWVVDASGGGPRDLTSSPSEVGDPQWSKDGTTVYFVSGPSVAAQDLWEVPAAGGAPRQLTHVGRIQGDWVDPASGTVFVLAIGGSEGQLVLDRVSGDGALEPLWNRTSVLLRGRPFSPSGDSVFFSTSSGKGFASWLLPTRGGEGRQLSGRIGQLISWSHDGDKVLYMTGPGPGDLYEMNIRDDSVRRLTHSPADDGWLAFFLPGDTGIVFQRQTVQQRIAVADVAKLMAGTGSNP